MGNKHKPKAGREGGSYSSRGSRKPSGGGSGASSSSRRQDYALFISHSWDYDQEYARLVHLLDKAYRFDFRNYSVPEENKLETETDEELEEELAEKQIKPASVVVVLAGLYSSHSKWIEKEIKIAKVTGKPILGVKPWGSDRISSYVERNAEQMVSWNTDSVVEGIRELAP